MGYSDMTYRGKSFQAHDAELAIWMSFVIEAIDRSGGGRPQWLDELCEDWQAQATGGFGFGIMPELDKFASDDRSTTMLTYFHQALGEMERHGDFMRAEELNSLQPSGPNAVFTEDLPMERFRQVGRRAIELLEGKSPES